MGKDTKFFTISHTVLLLLGAVIIGGGLFLYFKNIDINDEMKDNLLNASYNNAVGTHLTGDEDASIAEFEEILNNAPDNNVTIVNAKQFLIDNLFNRNEGDDRLRAVKLAEEVFNDTNISPRSRARTFSILASLVMNENASFFELYFTDDVLKKYLPDEGISIDPYTIAAKMLKDAENVYPTAFAEYSLAFAHSQLIGKSAGDTQDKTIAEEVRSYINAGDETLKTDNNYLPGVLAKMYYLRATTASYMGRILNDMDTKARELIYQDAIEKIGKLPADRDSRVISWLLSIQFRYAGALVNDTKGREDDIRELLKPFGVAINSDSSGYAPVNNFFKDLMQQPSDNILKNRAVRLAKISPEFKNYLLRLGWVL